LCTQQGFIEEHMASAASALAGSMTAGVVDEDAAHQLRGQTDEVRAVLPGQIPLTEQLQKGLVHEGGGLKRVVGPLMAEVPDGESSQLAVDERHEAFAGAGVAFAPCRQQTRHIARFSPPMDRTQAEQLTPRCPQISSC